MDVTSSRRDKSPPVPSPPAPSSSSSRSSIQPSVSSTIGNNEALSLSEFSDLLVSIVRQAIERLASLGRVPKLSDWPNLSVVRSKNPKWASSKAIGCGLARESLMCASILRAAHKFKKQRELLQNTGSGFFFNDCKVSNPKELSALVATEVRKTLPKNCNVTDSNGFLNFSVPVAAPSSSSEEAKLAGVKRKANTPTRCPISSGRETMTLTPIGNFHSCFKEKFGTPRQGAVARESRGFLELFPSIPTDALNGLEQFSHAWIHFWFHLNTNKVVSGKIKAPRLCGKSIGIFACRTPHRVNPIGQTLAEIVRVSAEERRIYFRGVDLVNGTPVLDIKPFHPADIPDQKPKYPEWIRKSHFVLNVIWTKHAEQQLRECCELRPPQHFENFSQVRKAVSQSISSDPRTLHSKRKHKDGLFGITIDQLDIAFTVSSSSTARVVKVSLSDPENFQNGLEIKAQRHRTRGLRTRGWLESMRAELRRNMPAQTAEVDVDPSAASVDKMAH